MFTSVAVTEIVEEKMTMIITFSTDITNEHGFFLKLLDNDEYIAKHHLL